MLMEEIKKKLDVIGQYAKYDNERAHIEQDELFIELLQHIGDVCADQILANKVNRALTSLDIEYTRWYA